jgi:hypothetical protein
MFKQYEKAHDIDVQTIQVDEWHPCLFHTNYKKQISHNYYYQIVTHEVCDVRMLRRMCECWQ